MGKDLTELTPDGTLRFHFHAGQMRAWNSQKRIVAVIAGTQGGKTTFGPPWLYREIQACGPGDYMVVTPTFPLLELKAKPELHRLFQQQLAIGTIKSSPTKRFELSKQGEWRLWGAAQDRPTVIHFGYAADPDSLEAATAKAVWLDEPGQKKFKLGSWEAIQRRLSVNRGRALLTTTPYDLGWLKQRIHDPWQKAGGQHTEIDLIRFRSIDNPAFPREEWERARRELPLWRFQLFYEAIFTRPAGLIYDCFDPLVHVMKRFRLPDSWPRFLGLDFGGVHTAGVFLAREPSSGRHFAYREYLAGGRTATGHKEQLLQGEASIPTCVGGSKSEEQWRAEFRAAGLPVQEPAVHDVEVGIDRVYATIKAGELIVFDDLVGLLDELGSYSRMTNERGEVQEEIENKEDYHRLDGLRYVISRIKRPQGVVEIQVTPSNSVVDEIPEGVFYKGGHQ